MSDGIDIDAIHGEKRRQTNPNAPYRRPPGGGWIAVAEALAVRPSTTRELMVATGYGRSTVERVLTHLRRENDECMENFRLERPGPLRVRPAPAPVIVEPAPDPVVQAMQTRSLLEQAWCGK